MFGLFLETSPESVHIYLKIYWCHEYISLHMFNINLNDPVLRTTFQRITPVSPKVIFSTYEPPPQIFPQNDR